MCCISPLHCRYVDQGGGKRPGAFAIYVEPWHADIFEVSENICVMLYGVV